MTLKPCFILFVQKLKQKPNRVNHSQIVSGHRGSKGVNLATWEVKPTIPTSSCGRQSSWLTSSADHLIRLEEERRGHRQAKFLRGFEVDDQLELHGLLYREVGRFHSLGNNNQFHELSPNSKVAGFRWREHALVRTSITGPSWRTYTHAVCSQPVMSPSQHR